MTIAAPLFLALVFGLTGAAAPAVAPITTSAARPAQTTAPTAITVTVGSDGACDYSNISQAAGLAPATDYLIIRVAKNVVLTSTQVISTRSVLLYGGYDTCSDATPSGRTTLNGNGFDGTMLWVTAGFTGGDFDLYLVDLDIAGGNSTSASVPGGGLDISGPWHALLVNSVVRNSSSSHDGGGINVRGAAGAPGDNPRTSLWLYGDSRVDDNTSFNASIYYDGGGIACSGQASLRLDDSTVSGNSAQGTGGGIYVDRCTLSLRSAPAGRGVFGNSAITGGGIGALNAAVTVLGDGDHAAEIRDNTASGNGGGIYSGIFGSGNTSTLTLKNAVVRNNTAGNRGGGIFAGSTRTIMQRDRAGATCHDAVNCSVLSGNIARGLGGQSGGGGLYATGDRVTIAGTFLQGNDSPNGAALHIENATDVSADGVELIGNVLTANIAPSPANPVVALVNSSARLGFNTFADNAGFDRLISVSQSPNSYPTLIYGSILMAGSGVTVSALSGSPPVGDCNRLSENASPFGSSSTRSSTTAVVGFVNPPSDYRLGNSQLLDWCDAAGGLLGYMSADGGVRPFNDPGAAAVYGNYDLGGLERQPQDRIFANGFEPSA